MIRKVVQRRKLTEADQGNLAYWLTRSPDERVEAVEILRRQWGGSAARLQKVVRVFNRADIEALGKKPD